MIACLLMNTDAALAGASAAGGRSSITTADKLPIAPPYEIFWIERLLRGTSDPWPTDLGAKRESNDLP